MAKTKKTEEELSLEELVGKVDEDKEDLEDIVEAESSPNLEDNEVSLVEQLSKSLPKGTKNILESSDTPQDFGLDLETSVRSEGHFNEDKNKTRNDFYNMGKGDDVYSATKPNKSQMEGVAGSYQAAQVGGSIYEPNPQDFYDSAKDISNRNLNEIEGIGFGPDVSGTIKQKEIQYKTQTF
jgi:hypothetical protein